MPNRRSEARSAQRVITNEYTQQSRARQVGGRGECCRGYRGRRWGTRFPFFSPPRGGDAVGRGGGHLRTARPPFCRSATSPPRWGEKILSLRDWCRDAGRLSDFLPPLGGRCRRQRGGGRLRTARPPSVAPRHLPPLGGENFLAAARRPVPIFLPLLEGEVDRPHLFSPPWGGGDAAGRGGRAVRTARPLGRRVG